MRSVAVTGSIGSGKSRVAHWLADALSVPLFDSDQEVRCLLLPGNEGYLRLKKILDSTFFRKDNQLDKHRLRLAIFSDMLLRTRVEAELHPLVLANLSRETSGFSLPCMVEVPLLYEVGWQHLFGATIVVYAEVAVCLDRIQSRDGVSEEHAMSALRSQMPIREKIRQADFVVDNNGRWEDTVLQMETMLSRGVVTDKKNLTHSAKNPYI